MKPYSKDLRLRVSATVVRGVVTSEEAAKTFSVSVPIHQALAQAPRQQTADVEPKPSPGASPPQGRGVGRMAARVTARATASQQRSDPRRRRAHRETFEETFEEQKRACWSQRPRWGGSSPVCPAAEAGRSKKEVKGSPRARRAAKRSLALAGFPHFAMPPGGWLVFVDERAGLTSP